MYCFVASVLCTESSVRCLTHPTTIRGPPTWLALGMAPRIQPHPAGFRAPRFGAAAGECQRGPLGPSAGHLRVPTDFPLLPGEASSGKRARQRAQRPAEASAGEGLCSPAGAGGWNDAMGCRRENRGTAEAAMQRARLAPGLTLPVAASGWKSASTTTPLQIDTRMYIYESSPGALAGCRSSPTPGSRFSCSLCRSVFPVV